MPSRKLIRASIFFGIFTMALNLLYSDAARARSYAPAQIAPSAIKSAGSLYWRLEGEALKVAIVGKEFMSVRQNAAHTSSTYYDSNGRYRVYAERDQLSEGTYRISNKALILNSDGEVRTQFLYRSKDGQLMMAAIDDRGQIQSWLVTAR